MLQDIPTTLSATTEARAECVIETERLTLRRPTHADIEAIAHLANDLRISQMTRRLPFPYRQEHAAAFVAALPLMESREFARVFLIEHLGEMVGCISVEGRETPELGYWLGANYWGRGFATEAARAALDAAFEARPIPHVIATARIANPASRNVLEKCGFVWQGCALQRFDVLGYSAPVDRFRLTRERWQHRLETIKTIVFKTRRDYLVSMTRLKVNDPSAATWLLQDAKARFSELVRRVRSEGPQHVTVHGRDAVVVIAAEEFLRLKGELNGAALVTAMQSAAADDIDIAEGIRMPVGEVDL